MICGKGLSCFRIFKLIASDFRRGTRKMHRGGQNLGRHRPNEQDCERYKTKTLLHNNLYIGLQTKPTIL